MASGINETIDLCDSEDEAKPLTVKAKTWKRKKPRKKKETKVEIITLDESSIDDANSAKNCSVLNEATLRLSLQDANNAAPSAINENEPNLEEDIQFIGESSNVRATAPASGGQRKFRFYHHPPANFVIDRRPSPALKAHGNPFFISGSNSARRKRKGKKKGGQGSLNTVQNKRKSDTIESLFSINVQKPPLSLVARWSAARLKAAKMLQAQAMALAATPNKNTKQKRKKENRKDKVVLQDGKPKFRLKPHNEVAQPLTESSGLSEIAQPIYEQEIIAGPSCAPIVTSSNVDAGVNVSTPSEHSPPEKEFVQADDQTCQQPQATSNWSIYGSNAYKSGHSEARIKGSLRPVVIDGSNVAMSHGLNSYFSCKGIEICSNYFQARGHTVVAFVPRYRMKAKSRDFLVLEKLEKAGIVKFTPSREVGGERITSYDDRFIVQFAADVGGIIVSNDNFRDLFAEQPLWRDTIRNRILQYTWITESYIMFPPDPLGSQGPNLDEFLRF